jgi:hypothetical protein
MFRENDLTAPGRGSLRAMVLAAAGPALIIAASLIVLRDFAFGGMITFQHPDLTAWFLPNHCFLGNTLSSGHIPAWNPYAMGGVPFASDPLSGWMWFPPMGLYALFSCDVAVRYFVVLQPVLAGLGIYWFLRGERASRPAAVAGGLALSLAIAASKTLVAFHFSGILAWSAVLLAVASRCLQARSWPARLAWIALTALVWGQLAATFLSAGSIVGSGALAAYSVYRLRAERREGRLTSRNIAAIVTLLAASLVAVNLAYLLPRLAYTSETSLGLGYDGMRKLALDLTGISEGKEVGWSTGSTWPLRLSNSPGAYMGAVTLLLCFGAFWIRRYRALAICLTAYGGICYLLGLRVVVEAIAPTIRSWPLADFYLHRPERLRYGTILVLAVLAGLGVEAWRRAPSDRTRLAMLGPGVLVWGALPLVAGTDLRYMALFAIGALVGTGTLLLARSRPALFALIPIVLAVELGAGALAGQASGRVVNPLERSDDYKPLIPLQKPTVDAAAYVRSQATERAMRTTESGRLLKLGVSGLSRHIRSRPRHILARIEEVQGYNSVQLLRYWSYVRTVNPRPPVYNKGAFTNPSPSVLDLLQIGWVTAREGIEPAPNLRLVSSGRGAITYKVEDVAPRASIVTSFQVVGSPDEAREVVASPSFNPSREAILERDPGIDAIEGGGGPAFADYKSTGTGAARVTVDSPTDALLIVRNAYAKNWRARVDDRPTALLAADYLIQAIPIPAGRHVVDLEYVDPWIGYGLAGSALALATLLGSALLVWRAQRAEPHTEATPSRTRETVETRAGALDGRPHHP